MKKISLSIDGMSCQACATRIEKVLSRKEAINRAEVNFASERANVTFDETQISENNIISYIENAGFSAKPIIENTTLTTGKTQFPYLMAIAWLAVIPFSISMIGMILHSDNLMLNPTIQFVIATIVQFISGAHFYRGAFAAIKNRSANMDVLVVSGTTAIWGYSVYMLLSGQSHHIYFEAAVMVIAFVSFGKYLELRVKRQSLNSMGLLMGLTPKNTEVWRNEQWESLPLSEVIIGDKLRIKQGEKIGADGYVLTGEAWCDEGHLTGESKLIHKKIGDKVFAGSIISNGSIQIYAEALGNNTLLGDMMRLLDEAQNSKAPIARLADKVAAIFVPAVLLIAIITFFANYILLKDINISLIRAVAVLVIACPCALGLATPAAIMAGMGVAARQGILFKDAASLENAGRIDTVVLDKTGTLTIGKPQVIEFIIINSKNYNKKDFLQMAAAIETHVSHPLANAILHNAKQIEDLIIPNANNINVETGRGVCADVDNYGLVKIGLPEYCKISLPENLNETWQHSSIVAISNKNNQAIFAIADSLRDDSIKAINTMKKQGINISIASGDQNSTVQYIANLLNIDKAYGNNLPQDKLSIIKQLQQQNHIVAMVGDGVNDAAALAQADIGMTLKGGTDIAEHTASVTLMNRSIMQVADTISIARETLKTIRQNLFFAFIYNILGIPLAAIGLLSPVLAGGAMALSSISVLSNAVRLKYFKPFKK
ncbi:MAG: heavy metal translocating P-type ATPase [Neisseriaceae bacterium]|nr:heavy metal translocating P-type ATPase [Neisseriaceae bacterium]